MKKRTILSMMLLAYVMVSSTSSCSNDDGNNGVNNQTSRPIDNATRAVFMKINDMAFPFFRQVCSDVKPDENFMISPLSLTEVLAMLANGANGATQKQILEVMRLDTISSARASKALQIFNSHLMATDKQSQMSLANSQWIDDDISVKDEYIEYNEEFLDAETFNQDLCTEQTMYDINSWCSRKTYGCIDELLYRPLSDEAKMVLINALYFKGIWKSKFDKQSTSDDKFTNYDGTMTPVKMMHQTQAFSACQGDKMDIVRFPYGNGSFYMDVVLPHEDETLDDCMDDIDLKTMNGYLRPYKVTVSMPRMNLNYRRSLKNDLKSMGMTNAFSWIDADFSGISNTKLSVSFIEQVTSIKVDEDGTEAAATTFSGMVDTAPTPVEVKPMTFTMNRPFVFLIRESQTGMVLFMGRMVKF